MEVGSVCGLAERDGEQTPPARRVHEYGHGGESRGSARRTTLQDAPHQAGERYAAAHHRADGGVVRKGTKPHLFSDRCGFAPVARFLN